MILEKNRRIYLPTKQKLSDYENEINYCHFILLGRDAHGL